MKQMAHFSLLRARQRMAKCRGYCRTEVVKAQTPHCASLFIYVELDWNFWGLAQFFKPPVVCVMCVCVGGGGVV